MHVMGTQGTGIPLDLESSCIVVLQVMLHSLNSMYSRRAYDMPFPTCKQPASLLPSGGWRMWDWMKMTRSYYVFLTFLFVYLHPHVNHCMYVL